MFVYVMVKHTCVPDYTRQVYEIIVPVITLPSYRWSGFIQNKKKCHHMLHFFFVSF